MNIVTVLPEALKAAASSSYMEQIIKFMKNGIAHVNELNKSLTQLSIIFNESQREVQKYSVSMQSLGQKLNVSSKEIANVAVEFARQGLNQQETLKQTENTVRFAKISNLDYAASAKILSSTVSAMNVDMIRASDVFSYLGNASSSTAGEISEAIQIIGGSANGIGVNFEKVSSWVAAVSSKTKESASTIGNSIKTILTRMQSLKQTGTDKEDNTQLYQVTKALEDVNVKLKDNKGNFRNFGDVMDELGSKWEGLTTKQKTYIAATVAGSSQQSGFADLMESYGDSLRYYEGALNSAGTTTRQFSQWQEGSEAAVNRFKGAVEGLWQNAFQSETIVIFTDVLTLAVQVLSIFVDVIGPVPILLGGVSTAMLILNANFRTAAAAGTLFTGVAASMTAAWTAAKVAFRAFLPAALSATLIGAGLAALSFALEKIIGLFFKAEKEQPSFDKMNESLAQTDANIKQMEQLNAKYNDSKLTTEELNSVREKMIGIMPEVIDHYDAEGKAVFKTSQEISELIKKEKELSLAKKKNERNNLSSQLKEEADTLTTSKQKIRDIQNKDEYKQAKSSLEATKYIGQFMSDNKLTSSTINQDTAKLSQLQDGISQIFKNNGSYTEGWKYLLDYLYEFGDDLPRALETAKASLGDFDSQIDVEAEKIKSSSGKFGAGFKLINSIILEESGNTDKNTALFLEKFSTAFKDSSSIDNSNYKGILNSYETMVVKIKDYVTTNKIDLGKLMAAGDTSQLESMLTSVGVKGEQLSEIMEKFRKVSSDSSAGTYDYSSSLKLLKDKYNEVSKSVQPLNEVIEDSNNGKEISAQRILELSASEEGFANCLKTENGQIKINIDAVKDLRNAKIKGIDDLLKLEQEKIQFDRQKLFEELEGYGLSIKGIRNVAEAKAAATQKLKELDEEEDDFLQRAIAANSPSINYDSSIYPQRKKPIEEAVAKLTELDKYEQNIKALQNSAKNSLKSTGKSSSSGDKSSSSPAKQEEALKDALEEKDMTKELINTFNQEHEARKRVNDQIERKIKLHEQNKNYNDAIAETTRLYESQKKSLEELNAANDKMRGQADTVRTGGARFNKSSLSNQDYFDTWFDPNNEGTKSFSDVLKSYEVRSQQVHDAKGRSNESKNKEMEQIQQEQDEVQRLFEKLQTLKNAYNANSDKINEMTEALNNSYDSLLRLRKDGLSYSLGHLDSSIEKIKNSMGTHVETGENYRRDLSNLLLLANEKKLKIDAELKISRDNIDSGKLTPEQIRKEKDSIEENEKHAMNMSNEINDAAYKRAQSTVKEAALEVEKYSDMLDVSKKRMEALEEGTAEYSKELINQGTIIQSKIAAEKQVQLTLEEQMKTAGLTEVQWDDFNKQLQTSIKNQLDLQIAMNSTSQGLKAQAGKLADEVINFYKEMYGKQKEVLLAGIQTEIEELEKAHKKKLSMLDEEMRKHEDLINAQLKAIDDKASLDDYNKQLGKLTSEKNALINEIKKRALNTTVEGKAKVAELEKQLADKTAEIEDLTTNRDREQQKKSLQEQLDNKKKYIDEETQLENKKFEKEKDDLDDRKKSVEKFYEEQINNEKKFAQIRSDILKGNIADATKELNVFSAFINGNMTTIGANISENLLSKITQFSTDLQTTSETMASTFMQTSASIENNLIKQLDVLIGKLKEVEKLSYKPTASSPLSVDEILKNMQSNSDAYNLTTNAAEKEGYHKANQAYMEELRRRGINIQYNPATGTYVTPGGVDLYNYRNPFNMPDEIFDKYLKNKEIYENPQSSDRQRFDAAKENADLREEYKIKSDDYTHAELEAAARFDTGGMTPSFGTGPKVALLDQKEIVLAQSDTSNLLKVVDMTRSIINGVKSFDFSRLNPFAMASATNTSTNIQKMEITIPADVKEPGAGKRFALDFISGLEARGVRIQT
ncbi:phage tail tape measure protein [Paenibacillus chitinolyticus]|uniref:phage tail tape measure protein n=1 Tax=Paenibacillus chitinolyticus TaxID=79263 RepID=UPI001C46BEC8|nr:phage tail tape measure protein [Paenibacillus chitinolyticus]MBV6713973.1 phage tail tape measure protein [Paenibacillus chitinolyticus]